MCCNVVCDVHIHMDIPCIDSFCFAGYELCAFGREKQSGSVIDVTCLSFFFLFFLSGLLVDYDYVLIGYLFTLFIFMWCHVCLLSCYFETSTYSSCARKNATGTEIIFSNYMDSKAKVVQLV